MRNLISHSPEGIWSHIAPLRLCSFDIECAGRKGIFPEALVDPVIQIAAVLTIQGEKDPRYRVVFSLRSCSAIVGAQVLCFDDEARLLMAFKDFLNLVLSCFYLINLYRWIQMSSSVTISAISTWDI